MTAKTSELLLQFNEYATAHDKAFERALVKHPNAKTFVIATTKDPCVFTFVPKHLTRFVEGCTTIGTIDRPTNNNLRAHLKRTAERLLEGADSATSIKSFINDILNYDIEDKEHAIERLCYSSNAGSLFDKELEKKARDLQDQFVKSLQRLVESRVIYYIDEQQYIIPNRHYNAIFDSIGFDIHEASETICITLNGEKLTNASTIEHWLDTYTPKWVKTASVKQRTTYELITLKHLKRIIQTVTGFANETMETSASIYRGELENLRLMTINALPRRT